MSFDLNCFGKPAGNILLLITCCGQSDAWVSISVGSVVVARPVASKDNVACGYYSTADRWIYTDETLQGGHFKCPMCQTFYRPFASTASTIAPNKVLVFCESETTSSEKLPGGVSELLGRVSNKKGVIAHYPCIWPDSASTALAHRMKEIITQVRTEVEKGMTPTQMIEKCIAIAAESAQHAPYFSRHTLPLATQQHIEQLNAQGGYRGRLWHMEHLQKGPWPAGKCPFKPGDLVLEPEAIMQIWAYSRVAIKTVVAAKKAAA